MKSSVREKQLGIFIQTRTPLQKPNFYRSAPLEKTLKIEAIFQHNFRDLLLFKVKKLVVP